MHKPPLRRRIRVCLLIAGENGVSRYRLAGNARLRILTGNSLSMCLKSGTTGSIRLTALYASVSPTTIISDNS